MPSTTLSLLLAGLALSTQVFLAFAAPAPVTWYLASTSTASKAAPSSTLVSSSLPSSSAIAPQASSTVYSGLLGLNSRLPLVTYAIGFGQDPLISTGTRSEAFSGKYYAGKSVCPDSTLPEAYKAMPVKEREMQGIALNEIFYDKHQGLRKYCGKQVELTNPANPSAPPLVFTVTRGTPASWTTASGLSILTEQATKVGEAWGWNRTETTRKIWKHNGGAEHANALFIEEIRKAGLYDQISQAFAALLPVKAVGVQGDRRTYEQVICLRAVKTEDFMTADWFNFPPAVLRKMSNRITNEVQGVNRVVMDSTSKPPGTVEWL